MRNTVRNLSPAMVVAGLALFISLGGVSYGVAAGSIDSREIKNGSVQSRDVRNGSLVGGDIRNGSVLGRDVQDGALRGNDIGNGTVLSRDIKDGALRGVDVNDRSLGGTDLATNTLGDREINEPQLDIGRLDGFDASRYLRNVRRVQTATASDPATPKTAPPARCPKGKRLIGGGARVFAPAPVPVALTSSGPSGNAWTATAYATAAAGNWQLVSFVICG